MGDRTRRLASQATRLPLQKETKTARIFRSQIGIRIFSFYLLWKDARRNKRVHSCFSSHSFWKAGSPRKGSQKGSSRRNADVRGTGPYSQLLRGSCNSRVRIEIARLFSPKIA